MLQVSIIILTKNRSRLLAQALESVRKQAFTDYEIIVINDGSTDNTAQVIEQYVALGYPIKAVYNNDSQGVAACRQQALQLAQCELVAMLDDDDIWIEEGKLSKQVEYFVAHPSCVLVGGAMRLIANEERIRDLNRVIFRPQTDHWIRNTMLLRNNFFTSTIMLKKSVAMAAGGFTLGEDRNLAEDYDLWVRMGAQGTMFNFADAFAGYRVPQYNAEKRIGLLRKQLKIIWAVKGVYPYYWLAVLLIRVRLLVRYGKRA